MGIVKGDPRGGARHLTKKTYGWLGRSGPRERKKNTIITLERFRKSYQKALKRGRGADGIPLKGVV